MKEVSKQCCTCSTAKSCHWRHKGDRYICNRCFCRERRAGKPKRSRNNQLGPLYGCIVCRSKISVRWMAGPICNSCFLKRRDRLRNKAERNLYVRQHRLLNRDVINERKMIQYYHKHDQYKQVARRRHQQRYNDDTNYRIASILRSRLRLAICKGQKVGSAVSDLGCSIDEFKQYLESKFLHGMTWDNWGRGLGKWHIDHIKPLSKFDLTDRQQFLRACHYTNLQPLWSVDNLRKGNRTDYIK